MKQWEFDERWKQGLKELAKEEERACGDWQNGEGMSEQSKAKLFARIEAEERKAARESERNSVRPLRLRKRYIPVLAAVLALMCGMGAVGSRVWRSDSTDLEVESEVTTKVDNETKDDILLEEDEICLEIQEKLGIAPLRMGHMPEGMVLDEVGIKESLGWAILYYLYDENVISVKMSKQSIEVSSNVQWDGASRKLEVKPPFFECQIEAYCMDEQEHFYGANILYGNGYYSISGKFEDENEFLKILEKIYFKKV